MAALGSQEIPPFTDISGHFFRKAADLLDEFTTRWNESLTTAVPITDHTYPILVTVLETRLLLMDYSMWHRNTQLREWGVREMAKSVTHETATLIQICLHRKPQCTWREWVWMEEGKRAVWFFYCLSVKTAHFLQHSISAPRIINDLDLSAPDFLFEATDEITWKQRLAQDPSWAETSEPFSDVSSRLVRKDALPPLIVQEAAALNSQILLCSLLEAYEAGTRAPLDFDPLRDSIASGLQLWESYFWVDPNIIWRSPVSIFLKINNALLYLYLQSRLGSTSGSRSTASPQVHPPIEYCIYTLDGMSETGIYEVSTLLLFVNPWTPRSCYTERHVCCLSRDTNINVSLDRIQGPLVHRPNFISRLSSIGPNHDHLARQHPSGT